MALRLLIVNSACLHGPTYTAFWQGMHLAVIDFFYSLTCAKGSLFGPYTPLQQLDLLADHGTKSYIVGSTNSLLLQQKDRYSDILINV